MSTIKNYILIALVFLFPLFFLPLTQEFFITNKIYLFAAGLLLLLVLSVFELVSGKKIVWRRSPFDIGILFFIISTILSIIIVSPNKIEAILNPYYGLLMLLVLAGSYFFMSHTADKKSSERYLKLLEFSGLIVALITIFFFFNPLKNVNLPAQFQFLKFATFSTLGNQLDLAIFLGFMFILNLTSLLGKRRPRTLFVLATLFIFAVAAIMPVYKLVTASSTQPLVLLAPFRQSWFAALEILKNPLTAIFGTGVANFNVAFSRVKDVIYNATPYWQIGSFNTSRSTLLHLLTEIGILGFATFAFLLYSLWVELKKIARDNPERRMIQLSTLYVISVLLFFPPSFVSFFLLFFVLFWLTAQSTSHEDSKQEFNLTNLPPVYIGLGVIILILVVGSGYILGRAYLAEFYFKKSIDSFVANKAIDVYNNQRSAISQNPYIERFRINFAQTNLIIANNVAAKGEKMTEQERQTVIQAIQAAISEAKSTVALNPQKAANWEALAAVYRYILNAVQGADVWAVSSYQRAIQLDPANPVYRLNLGGVYYALKDYNNAISSFEQAVTLKPDWANARYNLAWARYQAKDFQKAAAEMQNVLKLIDKKASPDDYAKAQSEYEKFKSEIPQEPTAEEKAGEGLQLPTTEQQPVISPKLELPEDASPEAR